MRTPFVLPTFIVLLLHAVVFTDSHAVAQETGDGPEASAGHRSGETAPAGEAPTTYIPGGLNRGTGGANVHGYGEVHFNQFFGDGQGIADFHRFVVGFDYDFSDRIRFGSELEVEHSFIEGGEASGEVELEQAWIQFDLLSEEAASVSATVGMVLIPFGRMNLWHEPTEFFSVERPNVNSRLIPTTWFEPGIQISGTVAGGLGYVFGVHAGLQGEGFSDNGIRGGRQKGNSARFGTGSSGSSMAALNFAGRVDWEAPFGLVVGGSFFASRVDHPGDGLPRNSWAFGWALDLVFTPPVEALEAFRFAATFAFEIIDKAAGMSAALGETIAKHLLGWYVELAFNTFHFIDETDTRLWVFVRFELYDTQNKVPDGFAPNLARDRTAVTFGLAFYPVSNVVVKLDYSDNENLLGEAGDQLNFGVGFQF